MGSLISLILVPQSLPGIPGIGQTDINDDNAAAELSPVVWDVQAVGARPNPAFTATGTGHEEPFLPARTYTAQIHAVPGLGLSSGEEVERFIRTAHESEFMKLLATQPSTMITIGKTVAAPEQTPP
ncbi:hypothetical protein E4T43_06922 [Aureobasidium subglaciale]|nr:hypothetical protein E4T43_06922 [Aureobasidium subglaciale]